MQFTNQYVSLPKDHKIRTTFEGSKTDIGCLRGYDPKEGNLQTTLSILLTKLCNELRKSNIQPGEWDKYQLAITDATIILGGGQRSTAVEPATGSEPTGPVKAPRRNVKRGAKSLASTFA